MAVAGMLIMASGLFLVAYAILPWVSYRAKTSGSREARRKAWFFTVLALAVFATLTAVQIVPPLLVEIASDLEISVAVASQLATATFAAWGVSVISVGPLSDSFGRRPVALAGLLVLTVSVLASAFAPNIEVLLALRILTGLGGGTIPPNSVAVVSDVFSPERRAQAVGGVLAINALTSAVSVPMVALLTDWGGWRLAFMVAGLLLASAFSMCWLWFPRDSRERVGSFVFFSRYRPLLSLRFFRVAVPLSLAQRASFWTFVSFSAAYLIHTYGLTVGFVALPLAIAAIGQVTGSYSVGFLATPSNRAALIAVTSTAGGICAFLFFAVDLQFWVAVAVATVGSCFLSMPIPVLLTASTEYSGESRATGAGILGLSNQGGGMIGAAIAGALLANTGYAGIGYLCLGVSVLGALMTSLFGRQFRESPG